RTGSRGLYVESSEAKSAAHQVHEREKPCQLVYAAAFLQRRTEAPDEREHSRSQSKRNNIRDRVQLDTNLGRGFGKTRDPSIEGVEYESPADTDCRVIKVAGGRQHIGRTTNTHQLKSPQGGHHRVEAGKNIHGRKQRRNDIQTLFHTAPLHGLCFLSYSYVVHIHLGRILPITVEPPRTCIPLLITRS